MKPGLTIYNADPNGYDFIADVFDALELMAEASGGIGCGGVFDYGGPTWARLDDRRVEEGAPVCLWGHAIAAGIARSLGKREGLAQRFAFARDAADMNIRAGLSDDPEGLRRIMELIPVPGMVSDAAVRLLLAHSPVRAEARVPFRDWCRALGVSRVAA